MEKQNITQKFLKETYSIKELAGFEMIERKPRVTCNDGFSVSIQASEYHYCTPRINLKNGGYYSVELGFPSQEDDLIKPYAEDSSSFTQTVYGYVPIGIVDELIMKHGGIKSPQLEDK